MTEGGSSRKKKGGAQNQDHGFAELIFSWSLDDILNEKLYEHQVEKIPLTFQSEEHYFRSFVYPLLEETRTELASCMKMMYRAPFAEISSFQKAKGKEKTVYDVTVGNWRNSGRCKEPYRTLPSDLLILTNGEPGSVSDLQSVGSTCTFLLVTYTDDDNSGYDGTPVQVQVTASQNIEFHDGMFAVFLMNITTQKRIWSSLHKHANLDIIKEILYTDSVVKEKCDMCSLGCNSPVKRFDSKLVSKLNESQKAAIMAAIGKTECCHKSSVEQIWGPPGTGKTMTVSVMLSIFLQLKCRTLTCAPTNVAIVAVASRVLSLVKESSKTKTASGDLFCSIGDVLLFGNKERLKVGTDIAEIYLDHRVEKLTECLGSLTGWKHCIKSMIDLVEDCVSQYHVFVENELLKEEQPTNEKKSKTKNMKVKSFIEFVRERFNSFVLPLRRCIVTFCTHIPRSFMKEENFQAMVSLLDNLSSLESLLSQKNLDSEELEQLFVSKPLEDDFVNSGHMSSINSVRIMSLSLLKTLQTSLGGLKLPGGNKDTIKRFCYERASLIFCTTSTSYTLQKFKMEPLKLLVIDEAAQMKESEAIIPLQIKGMRHAILIGDECQLPATVKSNVSSECGLGRSLFERLSSLGHSKHLLNVQYRMHPKISSFPNLKFYHKQILDAKNVKCKSYGRQYLSGAMFGPYSFINIVGGSEEGDDVESKRNMVEVSIVINIVQKLYKAWNQSKKKVSIGVVSPYAAQVVSIEEKLRYNYEKCDGFSVTVKSIDGFQGGEEDIIILSTVRSNSHESVGFISSPQRTNVALTRARHCLWILGNERTLARSDSIWKDLVCDARNRGCLFDADADKCLKKIIIDAKNELEPLNDMVKGNSLLLKHVKWKVLFSDNFRKSFGKLMDSPMKNLVIDLLQKLSGGWRPNDGNIDCKTSSKVLKTYEVEGLHVIWTTDIIKEFKYIQVLKVWDILPLKEIPKLRKEFDSIFGACTDDYMNRCTTKHFEGNLEIPKSWVASQEIIQFRNVSNCEGDNEVSESLLHMKFYSLSPGMVNHLRFGREIDLPMQLSDEQMDIFLCSKSMFIFGRLGTGKTTILMMKLLQNEQSFRDASKGFYETESSQDRDAKVVDDHEENKPTFLRQLFVTISSKSCHVVKQHVSRLTSISCDGNPSVEVNPDDSDVTSEFNVPDTFIDIPEKSYPLVITFQKFLMMLDGTLGDSFFERFHEAREGSHGNHTSSRSFALQTFIRSRNVTFDRFCSVYWPHFDSNLTKKLDPSRVFAEITFHIKGGLQEEERSDGKLNYEGYSLLSEGHASTLTKQKRETVDTIFEAYEKMKAGRGEFDLGDLVSDLHNRLKTRSYEGDQMDFIYIDELQDLSMKQISLFKYICQNVDEGFVFAGDTTQTIARGIDFRFEDMKSMFYTEFVGSTSTGKQEKGCVPEIFQLKQNSRTHGSVLELAQSVIDILYCYFGHSIGILEPETSLISGEAPVLLKSGNDKNAIMTIFGGTGTSKDIVGFSAEQVILVRDDYAKTEICKYVGKQALVLTIVECKGLEFQDVLLYNFFGSSPLKDQWSVIYGYMKEQDWLDEKLHHSFPSFKESRHNLLCSELKQLYVAITCTRERLWICENKEELSKPMFDYWKKRGHVQVRKLNDSVAREMRRASSPQEWLERGKKLFSENIFVMATMCFKRAGDSMWETMAKAFDLRTCADQIHETNPEAASCYLREAAEMFESIGKLEEAATCYCDSGEHERAGKIYLDKCGQIDAAAECFRLAGCYSDAAEAYAKGNQFFNCLSLCIKVELFDKGLKYIRYWKEHFHVRNKQQEQLEQEFLEICALSYYERKDPKSMMKFVRAFCSMESKRLFLRSLGCLDNLMLLEEESGHFLDAAELAGSSGDVLKEANLLEKAGCCEEATLLILWYVFFNSLWGNENTGWPLKQFSQKNVLCKKAKSLAKKHSNNLHDIVCSEINVLSHQQCCLSTLKKQLHTSQQHNSLRSEFILIRKILDAHFQLETLTYDWDHELPIDTNEYVEDKVSQNCVSVRTLVFYFNLWKDNVMDIFQTLESLDNAEPNQHEGHVDFTLNYFGVRKQCVKGKIICLLVNKYMSWVRNGGDHRDREILSLDGKQLVCAMRSYWQSELLSVGLKVLETIQLLYNLTSKGSAFHQSTSLLHMFEVSKFLLDCQYLDLTFQHTNSLKDFLEISMTYFNFVIPLDWRRSVCRNLISLRESDLSLNLLEEVILQHLNIEIDFTYWTIGRVMMMMICLSSKKSVAVYEKIILGLEWNDLWKSFAEKFWEDDFNDVYVAPALHNAMEDTYRVYCWLPGFMSPHSFVYLVDRLLFMTSFSSGLFFTTKSSFVEWYTCTPGTTFTASKQIFSKDIADFLVKIVQDILYKKEETISWIEQSDIVASYYHPLIALKLLMIVSLVSLQMLDCSQLLIDLLLGANNVAYLLPQKFVGDLLRRRDGSNLNLDPDMVAEAFASIEDPLLIVSSENSTPSVHAPCAIFVDLKRPTEDIMSALFSSKSTCSGQKDKAPKPENHIEEIDDEHSDDDHSLVELEVEKQSCNDNTQDSGSKIRIGSNRRKKSKKNRSSNTNNTLATVLLDGQLCVREDATPHETNNSWDHLHPSFASDMSRPEVELSISTSGKMEETDDEHSNDYQPPSNLVLEKESINKNTPGVEIKKRRQRTRRNMSKKDKVSLNTLATVLLNEQHCAGEDTTLQETNTACNDLQKPSSASDTSRPEVDFVVSRSDDTTMQTFVERGQSSREMVDGFSTQEWKVKQKVGLDCSNMTEALYEENHVEETGDEHSDGDHSSVKLEVEKQNSNNNTQDSGIKTGMGNRRRRSKKNRDSNTQNTLATVLLDKQPCAIEDTTLQEARNSWVDGFSSQSAIGRKWKVVGNVGSESGYTTEKYDGGQSLLELVLEKQTRNENTKNVETKKGKVKNKGMWIKKNKSSNGVNTSTGNKHSNVHLPVKLVLKKQTRIEKTKDVEIKKGKGKNMDKQIKKNKCSNNVNTSNSDKNSNDHSADARNKTSNETTKDVEVKKGKGKNKEKGIKKNKGSNSVNKFTGNEHSHIRLPVKLVLKKQTRIRKTKDVEIKKGKGKNMDKQIKKHKGNNGVNISNGGENSNDHSQMELMLEKETSNKNTKSVEIKKGKVKNMEKWIKKSTGSNSFTGDEHSKDHPPVEIKLENQTSNKNTHDAEIKIGKSKKKKVSNSLNPFTTVLVDGKHCTGEATTSGGSNSTCKDLKQSSSASDKRRPEMDPLVSTSGETTVKTFMEKLQSSRPVIDGFFNYVGPDSSNKTEEIHVEEIKVEDNIGDHSPHELLLEKQNSNYDTQDAETKNGKGKNVAGEDATMCKENSICNDPELPSSVFDLRKKALDAVKYGSILCKAAAFLGIRSSGGKLD